MEEVIIWIGLEILKELRKRARKSLSKEVRDAILSDLRTAFEAFERK